MAVYVALLRGINLGARNRISMATLRELFEASGAKDVQTYVQSGNVVFGSSRKREPLSKAVERRIAKELGIDIRVLLRTPRELERVVADNPFRRRKPSSLHVTFLAAPPKAARVAELEPKAFAPDEFRVARGHVYVHCPNGYGRSKLSNAFFEKRLGVPATTRNWNTVTKLTQLAHS
jgi:uncharacterized protein (DUF1697 family)